MGSKNFARKVLVITLTMLMVFNMAMPYNYSFALENEDVTNSSQVEDGKVVDNKDGNSEETDKDVLIQEENQAEISDTEKNSNENLDNSESEKEDEKAENEDEKSENEDEKSENEDEKSENEDEKSENDDEKSENDDEKSENDDEKSENDDEKSENDDEKSENDDEKSENDDEKSENDDEKSENDDEKSENDDEKSENDEVIQDADDLDEKAEDIKPQELQTDSIMKMIIPDEDVFLETYNFIVDGSIVDTQVVKNNDVLYQPNTPSKEGYRFVAWLSDNGGEFTTFGIQSGIEETQDIRINAEFEKVYYVTFVDEDGKVISTKASDENDKVLIDVTFSLSSTKSLVAWRSNDGKEFSIGSELVVTENTILRPVIKEGHSIVFETGENATIIRPQFVAANAASIIPSNPSRQGYTFDGWLKNGSPYSFGTELSEDITLTANWTRVTVNYTVIHWQEKANSEGYAVYESENKFGETEDTTITSPKNYDGFAVQNINEQSIKGDGSTIVNVYYDRNIYEVEFYDVDGWKKVGRGNGDYNRHWSLFRGTYYTYEGEGNGKWKRTWKIISNLTITSKYESNISNLWPTYKGTKNWKVREMGSTYQAGIDIMPLNGDSFYRSNQNGEYVMSLIYHLENLYDDDYYIDHADSFESENIVKVTSEDRYPITGFTLNTSKSNSVGDRFDWSYNDGAYTANFYYTRNTYSIEFFNNDSIEKTLDRKYGSNISDVSYAPEKTSGKEEYEFAGWFNNEACIGQPIDFNETMTAHNIIAYAKWVLPNINLTAYDNMAGTNNTNTHSSDLNYKGLIDASILPAPNVPEGYEFVYWAEKDANGKYVKFNFNTRLTEDIVLYPYMRDSSEFIVSYDINGGVGSTPNDASKYKIDASAVLKSANLITPPVGKVFLYWTTDAAGNSDRYYPYGTIEITGNMKLYAQYGPVQGLVTLTYHTNYPKGISNNTYDISGKANNSKLTVRTLTEVDFTVPTDYIFTGWKDGHGIIYQSGDQIIIDNLSSNILSAQWQEVLEMNVESNSSTKEYNGSEQVVSGLKKTDFVINGKKYSVSGLTAEASGLDVGTYPVHIVGNAVVTDENGRDVTNQFTITYTIGNLEIKPAEVTVTAQYASKEYGQSNPVFTAQVNGLYNEDKIDYEVNRPANDEAVGIYLGAIIATGDTVQGNYKVEYAAADFEITKIKEVLLVNVIGNSKTVKYNGTQQSVESFTHNAPKGVNVNLNADVTAIASGTDVGTYNMGLSANNFEVSSDIYANIEINIVEGSLNIEKRDIVFTSASDMKEYDGTPLTNEKVSTTGDGFVNDEGASFEVTGSQIVVGNSDNVFTYTLINGAKEENYSIDSNMGSLNIINRDAKYEITVTANSLTSLYDGTEQHVNGIISSEYNVAGNIYKISGLTAEAVGTDAGTYKANVVGTPVFTDASGHDVTDQFIVKTESGELTINKRNITFTSETKSKEYDGTTLTATKVSVTGDGFAANENVEFIVTGNQLLVGSSENTFTYMLVDGTKATNYVVNPIFGTLTVTSRQAKYELTVEANSDEFKYDGAEKSVLGLNKTVYLVDDKEYTVSGLTAEAKATDAGVYNVNIVGTPKVIDSKGHDVTDEFAVIPVSGKLVITKRDVVFTSATDSKEYDGTILTSDEVSVTGDGFANDEAVTFEVTGSQTLVGNSENTYTYSLIDGAKEDNYNITVNKGILSVTSREAKYDITIEANSGEYKYDGIEKIVNGLKESTFTLDGKEYIVSGLTVEAKATNAGEYKVNIVGTAIVLDAEKNDVTSEFAIKPVSGSLIINKRDLTFTSESASRRYNGYPLKNDNIVVTGDGFVEGEGVDFTITGSQTSVGSSDNTFDFEFNETTEDTNYNINKVLGSLTVNRRYVPVDPPETPDEPEEVIEEEETPGGNIPEEETTEEVIEEEETPGGNIPEEETIEEPIEEEEIPAGELPNTGGIPMSLLYLVGSSSIISGLFLKKKKEEDEK